MWFRRKERQPEIVPLQWIAVDDKRRLVATAATFEQLRLDAAFDVASHRVYERDRDGTWGELIGSYGVDVEPYWSPREKGLVPAVVQDGSRRLKGET